MAEELTVTQFNERVNSVVTYTDSLRNISVIGEVSGAKRASSGHIYFDLKDKDSVVRCTLFRYAASRVNFEVKDGLTVCAFGSASYYTKGGSFSFNVESLSQYGKGELQKKLEELTARLLKEGLFDAERKREPPRFPKVIGVVTSPTGAVIKDIIDTTARRFPVDILLAPATVQGDGAPESIVSGIEMLNKIGVDVIIVGRGGGSKEDLSAFNSEDVVRAVVASKAPVISAVGHATDKSLTDMAADKYAETPTAAAMIATPDRADELRNISNLMRRAGMSLEGVVSAMRARFESAEGRISPKNAQITVSSLRSNFDHLCLRMDVGLGNRLNADKLRFHTADMKLDPRRLADRVNQNLMHLDDLTGRSDRSITSVVKEKSMQLEAADGILGGLDPNRVLDRGYTMIRNADGEVITSVKGLSVGEKITIKMKDGEAAADITEVR